MAAAAVAAAWGAWAVWICNGLMTRRSGLLRALSHGGANRASVWSDARFFCSAEMLYLPTDHSERLDPD